jgi:hypothetical protein
MKQHPTADLHLACADCGQSFVFSAGERELQQLRGINHTPDNCPACTRRRALLRGPARQGATAAAELAHAQAAELID